MAEEQERQGQELQTRRPGTAPSPFEEMERLFEDFLGRRWMSPLRGDLPRVGELAPFEGRSPRVDVKDRENDVQIRAELPGVSKDDLDVSVTDNTVTIKASTRQEQEEGQQEGDYYRREIAYGDFARTVALPADVDADSAKAHFEDGVLDLTLPKKEQAKRRRIQVE